MLKSIYRSLTDLFKGDYLTVPPLGHIETFHEMADSWRECSSYPRYSVNVLGDVKDNLTSDILTTFCTVAGDYCVRLNLDMDKIVPLRTREVLCADLVAEAYLPIKPKNQRLFYINGDSHDVAVSNLEWH